MPSAQEALNQTAFRRLEPKIRQSYPPGRFVAIADGEIVADAASFSEVDAKLHQMGYHSTDVLVVQAGIEYPDHVVIFSQDVQA